jgi:hypothetical protein
MASGSRNRPAYSLVTAPDFFPLIDQATIFQRARNLPGGIHQSIRAGQPRTPGARRHSGEPDNSPSRYDNACFCRSDLTVTAVVGSIVLGPTVSQWHPAPILPDASVSCLPDAASNVFQPGWDISLGQDARGTIHTAYGLGDAGRHRGSSGQRFEGNPFHDLLNGPLTTVDELCDGTLARVKVGSRLRST